MKPISRRKFLRDFSCASSSILVGGYVLDSLFLDVSRAQAATIKANVFVAMNGSPGENVAKVIGMRFGGIENFVGHDDVVVLNPNGQWTNQGGSNCACIMGLIDLILNRPGGFDGEILVTECIQFASSGYWYASGDDLLRNGPYSFSGMVDFYHNAGHANVNGVLLKRQIDDPGNWPVVTNPSQGQGWVRPEWQSPTSGCLLYLPYPVIRSPYSNRLIDLKNGVYDNGFENQPPLRFVKIPNLNNHGSNAEQDYAGITSAVKSYLGITELEGDYRGPFGDGHRHMHTYHDDCHGLTRSQKAWACGESVGAWMNNCRRPDFCLTTAEWVGWESRTSDGATRARTVGLCDDPATLDYYMSKYVLWPTYPDQQYFNPDYDLDGNKTRQTIDGCISQGFGTATESEIGAYVYDFNAPTNFRFEIDRKIQQYREGTATRQDVLDLIESYNEQG